METSKFLEQGCLFFKALDFIETKVVTVNTPQILERRLGGGRGQIIDFPNTTSTYMDLSGQKITVLVRFIRSSL